MTAEERKDLYSCSYQDPRQKVYHDFLMTGLSKRHFIGQNSALAKNVDRHLTNIADAFSAAYSEADTFSLQLCIDFLADIEIEISQENLQNQLMQHIKQLFCIADFSADHEANGLLFTFGRHLADIHGPSLSLGKFINHVVKN